MEKKQTNMSERDRISPFFLNGKRAMVSLGPFAEYQHCPFRCAFCYVQDDFRPYAKLDIDEIVSFLLNNRNKYDIIYVSGDTDSFAPPRSALGIELLYRIINNIQCDITFTTRSIFTESEYERLAEIINIQKESGYMFVSGSSITRYSGNTAYLEPSPIPSPDKRILHIKRMKEIGAVTMLGLRPFLPIVDVNDYLVILNKLISYLDIALGEGFFFIPNGNIQRRVFPEGIPQKVKENIIHNIKMDFDDNNSLWDVWKSDEYEQIVADFCRKNNIIFAMHSEEALNEYREKCLN